MAQNALEEFRCKSGPHRAAFGLSTQNRASKICDEAFRFGLEQTSAFVLAEKPTGHSGGWFTSSEILFLSDHLRIEGFHKAETPGFLDKDASPTLWREAEEVGAMNS